MAARLAEMGVSPEEAARLTWKQKFGLYFPERDKYGQIKNPEAGEDDATPDAPMTLQDALQRVDLLVQSHLVSAEHGEQAKEALRKKYEAVTP